MGFNLDEIRQVLKQQKPYIWNSYTSSKPNTSNLVGKSDVAFGNAPQQSADSISDDFWRLSQESDANYYESRGYTFDGTKWISPNEQMSQRTAQDVPGNNSWFKGNRTYWENQAKNAYGQLNTDQRGLIDKDGNGSFSLEEIRDYQNNNGLFGDGKLGANTLAKLTGNTKPATTQGSVQPTTGSGTEPAYGPVQLPTVTISGKKPTNRPKQPTTVSRTKSNSPEQFKFQAKEDYRNENYLRQDFNKDFLDYISKRGDNLTNYRSIYSDGIDMRKLQNHPEYQKYWETALNNYNNRKSHIINPILARRFNLKKVTLPDGTMAYKDPYYGNIYYNNGRMQTNLGMRDYTVEDGRITRHQQGGKIDDKEKLQKAFMAFLIEDASTQGITIQSEEDLVKYTEALGEEGIKAKYQEFIKKMQGGIKAKYGAKLTQVRKLKGLCADDEELVYLKQGGRVCPVCQKKMKKAQEGTKVKKNAIEEFKNSRKQHVNPDDTVHVKPGVPRSLVNSDGSVVDKRFPAYSAEEYQRDLKTKDGRKRVLKQDIIASKCGGKTKKR